MKSLVCPRCGGARIRRHGSILSARGRVQRYECRDCNKKFHPSLKTQPMELREGYLDIETSQAGRGAGEWGIVYSWALKERGGKVRSDVMRERSLKEERRILVSLIRELKDFDMVYTWYGTGHDIPILRTRALKHGLKFPEYMELYHTDLLYVCRHRFKLTSNRLAHVCEFFGIPDKTPLDPDIWVRASFGDKKAFAYIHAHNIGDVVALEKVHERLEPFYRGVRRSI